MSNFISLFQEKFYYYKNVILSFPNIMDKQYVNNNFELITIQKDYVSDICSLIRFELWISILEDYMPSSNNLLRIYYDSLIIKEIIFN